MSDFIKPEDDPIEALKQNNLQGTIDPNYKKPELSPQEQMVLDIETLKYAVALQARYIEYIRGYLEHIVAPNVGGAAPHDMEVWVAIEAAPSKEEARKAVEGIMALRKAKSSRIHLI